VRIDLVNHATTSASNDFLVRANWPDALREVMESKKPSGGFWPGRAINHAVYRHQHSDHHLALTPSIVVLSEQPFVPDARAYLPEHAPDITVDTRDTFGAKRAVSLLVLRRGESIAWLDHTRGGFATFGDEGDIEVYDSASKVWKPVTADRSLLDASRFARWAELRSMEQAMESEPVNAEAWRERILAVSRDSGMLSQHTAYIVVENSAQWKMLERKEKDALKANQALTFDEFQEKHVTPEPGVWLMLALLAPLALWRWFAERRRQHAKSMT
jgi:hypothetical protein